MNNSLTNYIYLMAEGNITIEGVEKRGSKNRSGIKNWHPENLKNESGLKEKEKTTEVR